MCELFSLSSRLPTRAILSLDKFSRRGGLNGATIDGWGLAFYEGLDVRLYKEPERSCDSALLQFIESRRLPSRQILAHIRHAVHGAVTLANTQPFVRELGGRTHVLAHNGRLDGIGDLGAASAGRFRPIGETDSEIAFCLLLERLQPLWSGGAVPPLDARLAIVEKFAAELRELGPANFLYADGDALFAHGHERIQADGAIRPPGLWRLRRCCPFDADGESGGGGEGQELVLIASVPLTDEIWTPFAEGEVNVVRDGVVSPRNPR